MSWWNDLWRGVGDFFTGGAITRNKELARQNAILQENQAQQNAVNAQNYKDQQVLLEYQKALQERLFQREDTSVQRRVNDLIKAGLNPNLASNQGAGAGSAVSMTAPQQEYAGLQYNANKASVGAGVGQFLSNAVGVSQTMTSALASIQQMGITSDNRKWYDNNNLPYGYSGLASDIAAFTGSGQSLMEGLIGAEAAESFMSAIQSFGNLAGKGAEAAGAVSDMATGLLEKGVEVLDKVSSGEISIFDAFAEIFGDGSGDGRVGAYDKDGNRIPSSDREDFYSRNPTWFDSSGTPWYMTH